MNQKVNETGWFYHAPAKRVQNIEPAGVPRPSQIPGLGEIETLEPEEPREMVFRDSDTKYIRMAKMGGRKDLLTIRPNPEKKKGPVSYPRNGWFYLEDNELEDKAQKKKEQILSEPEEPTDMSKLLSNTYEREWRDRVNKWQEKQSQQQEKSQAFIQKDRPICSEYNKNYKMSPASSQKPPRRVSSGTSKVSAQRKEEEKQKEPFKMSKFKNVPARINSHQSPELLAAVGN